MKNKYFKRFLYLIALFVLSGVYLKKQDVLNDYILKIRKDRVRKKEYNMMHKSNVDITSLPLLKDEPNAWYTKYHYICHGGGGIDGKTYSNSLEAMQLNYNKGNRVFDSDMTFTKDGVLILRHSWADNLEQRKISMTNSHSFVDRNGHTQHLLDANRMNYKTFMSKPIYRQYTPMDIKKLIVFLDKNKEAYIAPDMKDDPIKSYQYLVNEAIRLNKKNVLDRIIVNIYTYDLYDKIMKIYPFKNVTIRQHYVSPNNYTELIEFCIKKNIHVVNLSLCYVNDKGVNQIKSKGIHVYVAVVDYISDMQEYYKKGYSGACTNWLYEKDWNLVKYGK
ncbi:phosphatidylinositol-specific phospholipase C/glycerophosphodiester phosphodiesterase family protein [Prevotella sp. oral taxon 299]|uniref:phosphatidylinositol-specific phospholipase C/glycerophosphodiester phosphodiesterase family protein n=1 Tax=Prevotella sp. oral taxon 299 TaxID=652716 RepID=UPI0002FC9EBD|nr:phosphatidylinositol-specific phospholipase C/glycerophosphodiester phosphodiesterase family protein [Prevotella sp. oral taxon 299]EFC71584.2 hypothetical protein HMPREF0669_00256 [Prevotella sp. oral taxon 299 str. F0039]